jgi:ketosteroid isomerase-like protein
MGRREDMGETEPGMETREVIRMEQALEAALVNGDTPRLEHLLSDDVTHVNPFGNFRGKLPWVAAIKAGQLKFDSCKKEDVRVRIYGETAVVTAINIWKFRGVGSDPSGRYRLIHVWLRREGRWQLIAHQATRIGQTGTE